MAELENNTYISILGFAINAPEVRTTPKGSRVLNLRVNAVGLKGQPIVQVTVWGDDIDAVVAKVEAGSFVAINGKYSARVDGEKVYHNLTAKRMAVIPNIMATGTPTFVKETVGGNVEPF